MLHQGVQFMLWNHCFGLSDFSVMTIYVVLFREFLNKSNSEVMAAHRLSVYYVRTSVSSLRMVLLRSDSFLSLLSLSLSTSSSCLSASHNFSARVWACCVCLSRFSWKQKTCIKFSFFVKEKMCLLLVWMCSNIDDLVPHWQIKPSWILAKLDYQWMSLRILGILCAVLY